MKIREEKTGSKVLTTDEQAIAKLVEATFTGGECHVYVSNKSLKRLIFIIKIEKKSWIVPFKVDDSEMFHKYSVTGSAITISDAIKLFMRRKP